MKVKLLLLLVSLLAVAGSCKIYFTDRGVDYFSILNPEETFEQGDAPETFTHESLEFISPWGYNKVENDSRLYPLLVAGYWGEGDGYYRRDVEQVFPSFTLEYQRDSFSSGESLALWIQSAIDAGYRIDPQRIYLTGFSRGGSGSFPLAKGMFAGEMPFAAIIRCAGQSQWDLTNEIAEKTAVWYHIGTNDTSTRVAGALQTLENFREYDCYSGAVETSETDELTGYNRTTIKLRRSGQNMFIYSVYEDMGHTPGPCYDDEALFPWLFSHSLAYR